MSNIKNVTIPANTWTDLNALTGIALGTDINLLNESSVFLRIQISTTPPVSDSEGISVSTLEKSYANADITSLTSTEIVWVRVDSVDRTARVAVQEVS